MQEQHPAVYPVSRQRPLHFPAVEPVLAYLGRFERLNSLGIAREPVRTLRVAFANLLNLKAAPVSLCFALFIFLTYLAVYFPYETARERRAVGAVSGTVDRPVLQDQARRRGGMVPG